MKKIVLLLLLLYLHKTSAQVRNSYYSVSVGVQITLNYKLGIYTFQQNFPGIKAYLGFNSSNDLEISPKLKGSFNFGTSIGIYNKSLGNSMNLDFQDNQVDWTNNFSLGLLWGKETPTRLLQTIHNISFYNLQHRSKYAAFLGVNFIMNSTKRNQTVGNLSLTFDKFSMTYYNDGGPILSCLGLGDGYDRYWTGGLMLYWHDNHLRNNDSVHTSFNKMEFSFDQFTGYKPQMFELLSILGADIQDYDIYGRTEMKDSTKVLYTLNSDRKQGFDFNASQYKISYNYDDKIGGSVGVIGSLRDAKHERYFALQDIIHVLRTNPIHPNRDTNRLFFGFNYRNILWKD